MTTIIRSMFLALLFICTTAFANNYTIAVMQGPGVPGEKPSDMHALWSNLAPYLNKNTGEQFTVTYYKDFDQYMKAISSKNFDFAYSQYCGSPAEILRKIPDIKILATVLTKNMQGELKPTYYLYLITARKGLDLANKEDIQKLNGKTIATSNDVGPGWGRAFLAENKIQYTKKLVKTHTEAIMAVLNGQLDATIAPDRPIKRLTQAESNQLRIVPVYELSNGAMFARSDIGSIAEKVQAALLKAPAKFFVGQLAQGFGPRLTNAQYKQGQ